MRIRTIAFVCAMVVAFSAGAGAQQTITKSTDPNMVRAAALDGRPFGSIDFGGRFSDVTGDEARYNRYRDLRNGALLENALFSRRGQDWTLDVTGYKIGYRDQQFQADYNLVGKVQVSFDWNQVPMWISQDTRTLYTQPQPGVFRLDDRMQAANEARTTTIRDYASLATGFDTRMRRDIGNFDFVYTASKNADLKFNVTNTVRNGAMHKTAPFGFSNVVELALPIDHRTTDAKASYEWATRRALVSVGWTGSWFDNKVPTLIWDNPLKINDSPSYSSAYSDGRGPSQSRMALEPSNTSQYVHGTGSVATAGRGRLTAYVAIGSATQNAQLLPHTINSQIPVIPLERATAEAEIRNTIVNAQYTMRPVRMFSLNARYRYADMENRTPHFETLGRVRFDGVYDDAANSPEPEPYSVKRQNLDVDATFNALPYTAFRVGYGFAHGDRTFRVWEETSEDTFRASADTTGNRYVSFRAIFERSNRTGNHLEEHVLEAVGEQPGMRHYDVANRDRKRFTLMTTLTPIDILGFNVSAGVGREEYPDTEFGLQAYDSDQFSVGFDLVPNDRVGFSVAYGWEDYDSLTASRTASPLPSPQFTDPTRNWWTDFSGKVTNVDATLDVTDIAPRTSLRFSLNVSDVHDRYTYVVPPNNAFGANNTTFVPAQLPEVVNELLMGTLDLTYRLTDHLRLSGVYWYEKYDVSDYALGEQAMANIVLPLNPTTAPTSLLLGYRYRPYEANTGMLRLTYLW